MSYPRTVARQPAFDGAPVVIVLSRHMCLFVSDQSAYSRPQSRCLRRVSYCIRIFYDVMHTYAATRTVRLSNANINIIYPVQSGPAWSMLNHGSARLCGCVVVMCACVCVRHSRMPLRMDRTKYIWVRWQLGDWDE